MKLKPGDQVVMNDKYYVHEKNRGKVWTVTSEPWLISGNMVVKLEGLNGCYSVDGLDKVGSAGCNGDYCEID